MNRNELLETLIGTFVVGLIATGIVWLGWEEPLSYRFMSREAIAERELVLHPPPPPPPAKGEWTSQGTALDRVPDYRDRMGRSRYNESYDHRPIGMPMEGSIRARAQNLPPR